MLETLSIQNVLLIDRLELSFSKGLSVLTGETGAGKSILLDSLGLVLGDRGAASFVRPGAQQAVITALFRPLSPALISLLEEHDIPHEDDTLMLRRTLTQDGRSKAYVNDQLVSLALLRSLGGFLLEIHGQFDSLLSPAEHRSFLDRDPSLQKRLPALKDAYGAWQDAKKAHDNAQERLRKAQENEAFLRYTLEELEALCPQEQEEETLSQERALLVNGAKYQEGLERSYTCLAGDKGALALVMDAGRHLTKLPTGESSAFDDMKKRIESVLLELEDLSQTLVEHVRRQNAGPERLEEVETRLSALRSAARKHHVPVTALCEFFKETKQQVASLTQGEDDLIALEKAAAQAKILYEKEAAAMSDARRLVALALTKNVMNELAPLKLEKARFEIALTKKDEDSWDKAGWDHAEFLIQTNPGLPMGPLAKIASGGERSRFLLALKVAFSAVSTLDLMVFDEIDAGVGGAVAHAIGERLSRLAKETQVLTVTHAPQVAAFAASHFVVSKQVTGNATTTRVTLLADLERREEIARMLSGDAVEDAARSAADALLQKAL